MMEKPGLIELKNSETPEKTRETIFNVLRSDLADWMTTDRDLVWRPAIELTKEDNEFAARALVPGVDPEDVEVLVAPELLLIKGETHRSEPGHRKLLGSLKFPRPVNPDRVHAEIKDGMLAVRAEIAEAAKANICLPRAA
jgi:HSP20 family molecular chaperone IbpA